MHVGEKIRQLRLHQQLTQGELVDGICSVAFLSKVEKGLSKPSAAILEKLAARLQIPVNVIDETQEDDIGITIDRITEKFLETATITDDEARILDIERYYSQPLPRLLLMYSCLIRYWLDNQGRKNSAYIDDLIEQSQNLISITEEQHFPIEFFVYYEVVASYYSEKSMHTKTEVYLKYAERFIQNKHLPKLRVASYYYISGVLASLHYQNGSLSRVHYHKAIYFFEEIKQYRQIASTFCSIAWTYIHEKKHNEALIALQNIDPKGLDAEILMILHNCYAHIYKNFKEYQKALEHLNLAKKALLELNQQASLAYLLRSEVEIYIALKKWDKTDELITKGIEASKNFSYSYNLCKFLKYRADIQKIRGDYNSYEKYIRDAIECAIEYNIQDLSHEISYELADYYTSINSYKKAVRYYKIALENNKKRGD